MWGVWGERFFPYPPTPPTSPTLPACPMPNAPCPIPNTRYIGHKCLLATSSFLMCISLI
ncbi:hypothetical protein H6G98_23180 [Nostoc sp. FACHB-857]|nr:hypothetical protein [Nostoc sp. FACHB-857]